MFNIEGKPVVSTIGGVFQAPNKPPDKWSDTITVSPPTAVEFTPLQGDEQRWKHQAGAKPSWRRAKELGLIVMNPYDIGIRKTDHFIARIARHKYYYAMQGRFFPDCEKQVAYTDYDYHDVVCNYTEQGDFKYWKGTGIKHYQTVVDYDAKVEHIKTALLSKLNTTYDLLTELAEGKETIKYLVSLLKSLANPIRTFKQQKDALYKSFHRGEIKTYSLLLKKVADLWMQYRYAISPIIYSIQDILKTFKLKDAVFRTERAYEAVDVKDFERDPILKPSLYLHDTISGSIHIRAVGKDGYSAGTTLQVSDLLGFNPIVTVWEKIPYSFVIDWALNVGDFLNASLSSLTSLASQRVCAYSVRCDYEIETRLHWDIDEHVVFTRKPWVRCGVVLHPGYKQERGGKIQGNSLVRTHKVNTFKRVVFDHTDVNISVDLQMNWKRTLDALSLSLNQARKRISRLR